MSYIPLVNTQGPNQPIIALQEWVWKVLCIKVEKKPCINIHMMLDYLWRWMELSGRNWKDVCLLFFPYVSGHVDRVRTMKLMCTLREMRHTISVSPLNINYPILQPVHRLLYDFTEAEMKGNRRRLYQLTGEWRDMGLIPLRNPKGPLNKSKFYRYTRDVRLSVHALLCSLWMKRPGKDVKNMLLASIWIE